MAGREYEPPSPGEWVNRGETSIYESPWVNLVTADVKLPDGSQVDHHVVRLPVGAAGCILVDAQQVLLMYRHRFITDTWGWEIPAGRIDPGESPVQTARREAIEETGWDPGVPEPLCAFHPSNGLSDQKFHVFISRAAVHLGEPTELNEAVRVEWHSIVDARQMLATGDICDGLSFSGLSHALAVNAI